MRMFRLTSKAEFNCRANTGLSFDPTSGDTSLTTLACNLQPCNVVFRGSLILLGLDVSRSATKRESIALPSLTKALDCKKGESEAYTYV